MAVVASYTVSVRHITFVKFLAIFTDTSTGGADQWLWDFDDGHCSTEQNPEHWYYGRWDANHQRFTPNAIADEEENQIIYNVKLTAWKNGVILTPKLPSIMDYDWTNNSDEPYISQALAQTALDATLPYQTWVHDPAVGGGGMKYHLNNPVADWKYESAYTDANLDLSAYPLATHTGWMDIRLADRRYGSKTYFNGWEYAVKIGAYDKVADQYDTDSEIAMKVGDSVSDDTDYNCRAIEEYLGTDVSTIRCGDAYGWEHDLRGGGFAYKGYFFHLDFPRMWLYQVPSTDDIGRTSSNIEPNPVVLDRPPLLYGGIKEAYFEDGWENEKYIYIEQSSPFPCAIQFIDVYAECANE